MRAHTRTHTSIRTHTHTREALKDLLIAALEKAKHIHNNWKQQVDCCGLLMQRRLMLSGSLVHCQSPVKLRS